MKTLDGMTPAEWIELVAKAGMLSAKEQIASMDDFPRPLNVAEESLMRVGVIKGGTAMFRELHKRGLIREQP